MCVFICRKWSYAIVGNMVIRKTRINWLDEKHLLINFYSKVLQLSKLPRCRERQILPNQNISKVEQMVNSAILAGEKMPEKYTRGGRNKDLLRSDTMDIYLAKHWCPSKQLV